MAGFSGIFKDFRIDWKMYQTIFTIKVLGLKDYFEYFIVWLTKYIEPDLNSVFGIEYITTYTHIIY